MAKKKATSSSPQSRRTVQAMLLAGTIPFPTTFPELGVVTYEEEGLTLPGPGKVENCPTVTVEQPISPKLTIWRTFFAEDVVAVFVPDDEARVKLDEGNWLLAGEIKDLRKRGPVRGIVYVRESAQALLYMQVGMTAAESAEYYPPLPDDRSVNHYRFGSAAETSGSFGCDTGASCN